MRLAVPLFCCALAFGQNTSSAPKAQSQAPANSLDQKSQKQDYGLCMGTQGRQLGTLDILSDTQGVDFCPYLQRLLQDVKENWYHLIPASATMSRGKLAIEFAIRKDGKVADMRLVASSGDVSLDRPAWGSIAASSPFPPLPSEFTGPSLALRLRFYYNPDKNNPARNGTKTKSGIAVSITVPVPGDTDVPLGALKFVRALVTGTGSEENTVVWSILGCSDNSCGEMTKDAYHAPAIMPSSPFITLTAVSTADPDAKASVTLHLVGPDSSHGMEKATARVTVPFRPAEPPVGPTGVGIPKAGVDFSTRYAWYVRVIQQKVAENWKCKVDPLTSAQRIYLTFDVAREGHISNVQIEQSSGVPSLDFSAVRAVQAVTTFGPLPYDYAGNKISVEFFFDCKP